MALLPDREKQFSKIGGGIEGPRYVMEYRHKDDPESNPTYKLLFLGACVIIGACIGWVFKDLHERVRNLETGAFEHSIQIDRLQEGHRAQDKALASIERDVMQLDRQRR
jgi:hypothetical protein